MIDTRRLAGLLVAGALLGGCGAATSDNAPVVDPGSAGGEDATSYVGAYCLYGAVSEAQLQGCEDHVTPDVIDGYDTNAARYARGEIDECLADAGPFCEPR